MQPLASLRASNLPLVTEESSKALKQGRVLTRFEFYKDCPDCSRENELDLGSCWPEAGSPSTNIECLPFDQHLSIGFCGKQDSRSHVLLELTF